MACSWVDGFPRTKVQVDSPQACSAMRLLRIAPTKFTTIRWRQFLYKTGLPHRHPLQLQQEKESVERQTNRGRHGARAQPARGRDWGGLAGRGAADRLRRGVGAASATTCSWRSTYRALQSLKQVFHFYVIDAQGDVSSVEKNINKGVPVSELASYSALEDETFDAINHIPLATDIVVNARQHLVRRLDSYQREALDHRCSWRVLQVIDQEFMPVVLVHGITGLAKITTENQIFAEPLAMNMLIDVLNERGYRASGTVEARDIPARDWHRPRWVIQLHSSASKRPRYRFEIRFQGSVIRRGL